MMRYEIILHWSTCDKEFHYELVINGITICRLCSLEMVFLNLLDKYKKGVIQRLEYENFRKN